MTDLHARTIRRRLGSAPRQRGSMNGSTCPDVLELDSGDYLVIGKVPGDGLLTAVVLGSQGASVGDDEQAVILPRQVLHDAAADVASAAAKRYYAAEQPDGGDVGALEALGYHATGLSHALDAVRDALAEWDATKRRDSDDVALLLDKIRAAVTPEETRS